MQDDSKPSSLDLGLYARSGPEPRITAIEIIAGALSLIWLAAVVLFGFDDGDNGGAGMAGMILSVLAILLPVALIWVAAMAARTARALRQEAARLQASIDAMRAAYVEQQQKQALDLKPDLVRKLDELVASQGGSASDARPATFTSMRAAPPPEVRAAIGPSADPESEAPQPALALALSQTPERDPISVSDFIKALNFPENEHDKEGFRTLRRALEDRGTERLIRASQDVLTLLSQDGIYMDDLRPDRARPEIWRRFAQGERGRPVAALGGIHDRSSLVLAAGRMKKDPVFRDAAHHFLRHFDRTFMGFEKNASDEEIARLADTRTARAFMLLGRVTGTFD
ncbi:hypothetical protein roselon_01486 [Roseibacterium elongatum DSM 19469]|uniref:Uncharacterized protein n=1 Tax=Roseicyclus elongatus DSM 19469 TaxID=1294273 RepID=W8RRR5_9RHOB|nr:hypothetical protein [Roseibacterium elongatum]AHM03869.1 hypothetical protein roselon_01486 [Roseibacterium elongatum DSM 19469]